MTWDGERRRPRLVTFLAPERPGSTRERLITTAADWVCEEVPPIAIRKQPVKLSMRGGDGRETKFEDGHFDLIVRNC